MCTKEEEYGRTVHWNEPNSGPLQENGAYYGMWVVKRWWEKDILDLVGAWEVTAASEEEVGAEETEG